MQKPQIVIISGEIHEGKTALAQKVVSGLLERNIRIAGFLSIAVNEDGQRARYDLFDIETSERTEQCSTQMDESRLKMGRYYFKNATLLKGLKILSPENVAGRQLIVIDEIGPLELGNKGWSSAIENLCRSTSLLQLWVVRRSIVKNVIRRWGTGDAYIYDTGEDSAAGIINKITDLLARLPSGISDPSKTPNANSTNGRRIPAARSRK